uniref:MFS domain-containing protein n=1 Tax=Macrostomum lignano TaxID=282301 RepID=A0A1I8JCT3_9PLAT
YNFSVSVPLTRSTITVATKNSKEQIDPAQVGSSSSHGDPSAELDDKPASKSIDRLSRDSLGKRLSQTDEQNLDLAMEFHPADGGCVAWLVCFTSFCTNGTIFSVINSFGIISEWLITNYSASKSLAGAIGSAAFGCLFFFSFLASVVTDRVGIRPVAAVGGAVCALGLLGSSFCDRQDRITMLLFTHSFLFGAGAALVYTPSLVILGHYFERRMGLVNGIVTLGSGVFSIPLTKIMKPVLLDGIGLSNTFRLLAGMSLLMVLYALTWRQTRPARHAELDHYLSPRNSLAESVTGIGTFLSKFCNVSIWRSRGFLVWIVACPCAMFGYFVPFVFLSALTFQAALRDYNHRVLFISLALLFGLCDGAVVCLMGPIAFDLVGPSGASQAIGFLLLAMSVPTTVGAIAGGLIRQYVWLRTLIRMQSQIWIFMNTGPARSRTLTMAGQEFRLLQPIDRLLNRCKQPTQFEEVSL